jgi:hypothetical protein
MKEREAMGDGCRDEVKRERARKGNQEKWRDRVEPWDVSCVNRRRLKLETRGRHGHPRTNFPGISNSIYTVTSSHTSILASWKYASQFLE